MKSTLANEDSQIESLEKSNNKVLNFKKANFKTYN